MTIGAQSVSAIMPKRMFGVSGESSAYTLPAHPPGRPFINVAALLAATAVLRNLRLFIGTSKLQVQFEKSEVDGVPGIDGLRDEAAGGIAEVAADADVRSQRHVSADVVERAESGLAVRRPPGVAERRGLERASAGVPEVSGV